jgi:2-iminobutanoate/2-iminopropanoate deaminase
MPTFSNPPGVAAPIGLYSHCASVKAGSDLFFFAGQVGSKADGTTGKTIEEQADNAYANVIALLKANNLTPANIVKLLVYVTDRAHRDAANAARRKYMGEARPASTFIICAGLAQPDLMIEIDVTAAR